MRKLETSDGYPIFLGTPDEVCALCASIVADFNNGLRPSQEIDATVGSIDALLHAARTSAMAWAKVRQGHLIPPTFRLYSRRGKVVEIIMHELHAGTYAQSAATAVLFAMLLRTCEIDGYFLISEAWVADADPDPGVQRLAPSERSVRREVLFVSAANRSQHVLKRYPTLRRPDGLVTGFGEPEPAAAVEFNSAMFLDLFSLGKLGESGP